jgi:hypothetical protein
MHNLPLGKVPILHAVLSTSDDSAVNNTQSVDTCQGRKHHSPVSSPQASATRFLGALARSESRSVCDAGYMFPRNGSFYVCTPHHELPSHPG